MFSSSFTVSDLTQAFNPSWSSIWCEKMSQFHFFPCGYPFCPALLVEETLFPIVHCFLLCLRLTDHKWMGLYLGFLFWSTDLYVSFYARTILQYGLKLGSMIPPAFFFFSRLLWLSGLFSVSQAFLYYLFQFSKKCPGHFYRDCIRSVDCFGSYGHFNNIKSSSP